MVSSSSRGEHGGDDGVISVGRHVDLVGEEPPEAAQEVAAAGSGLASLISEMENGGAESGTQHVRHLLGLGHHFEQEPHLVGKIGLGLQAAQHAIDAIVVEIDLIVLAAHVAVILPNLFHSLCLNLGQLLDHQGISDPGNMTAEWIS